MHASHAHLNLHFFEAEYGPALAAVIHGAFVLGGLLLYVVTTRAGHQRRHPSAAFAWVVTIALLPYAAIPLFLLFGTRKLAKPAAAGQSVAPITYNTAVRFHADGAASSTALLAMLAAAQQRILLATFIFADDTIGNAVVAALVERAAAASPSRCCSNRCRGCAAARHNLRGCAQPASTSAGPMRAGRTGSKHA